MKYLVIILFLAAVMSFAGNNDGYSKTSVIRDTVPTGAAPQLFGGKLYEFRNYVLIDSFLMIKGGDTFAIPRWPAVKFKTSDRRWYGHDNTRWQRFAYTGDSGISQNLQQVTDIGNQTNDTIIAKGLRTSYIVGDTINDPDFEIVVLPDLQYQTLMGVPFGIAVDSSRVGNTFNWIVANKIPLNIQAVLQVGDLTDDGNVGQFARVDSNYDKLDNNNIPYLFVPGNHDYSTGGVPTDARDLTQYEAVMGPARYTGKAYYGGNFQGSNANYYIKLDVGRQKYIVVGLEFMPRDTALGWANKVLDTFVDRKAIIVTHGFQTYWGLKSADTSIQTAYSITDKNNGQQMWDKLIRKKRNIFMVLSGHHTCGCGGGSSSITNTNLGYPTVSRINQSGDYGNVIYQLVDNYQADSLGGAGKITRLKFRPSAGKIDVMQYDAKYDTNDPRFTPYTLDLPALQVEAMVGIGGTNGGLNVAGETRLDSNVYITKAIPNRIAVYGHQNKLDTVNQSDTLTFLAGFGKNYKAKFRTLVASDIPDLSGSYIQNKGTVTAATTPQTGGFFTQGGTSVVSSLATGSYTLMNSTPVTLAVTQGAGNWGLAIERAAGVNTSGANLTFYHTYGTDLNTKVAVQPGAELGVISWFGSSGDLLARRGMSLRGLVTKVASTYISTGFDFRVTDTLGAERVAFSLTPWQNATIGHGLTFTQMVDRLTVLGTCRITDTLKLPNIQGKAFDTSQFKISITDVSGNHFKLNDWDWLYNSGGITGSGTAGQLAFWNGTSSITGDNGLKYITSSGNELQVENDGADADGAVLNLYLNDATPTAAQRLGEFHFYGNNASLAKTQLAAIYAESDGITAGAENGKLLMNITTNGAAVESFSTTASGSNTQTKISNTALFDGTNTSANFGESLGIPVSTFRYRKSVNGQMKTGIVNPNTGTGAFTEFQITNDDDLSAGEPLRLMRFGNNYATAGGYKQDGAVIEAESNVSGGLSIMATAANTGIRFYTGSYEDDSLRIQIKRMDSTATATGGFLYRDAVTREMRLVAAPTGTTYTFINGLTESGGTAKLGGTQTENTTINTAGFTTTWTGSNDSETSFSVSNTGSTSASAIEGSAVGTTSVGVTGSSTQYIGVFGNSTSNTGIQGQSSSGVGVIGVSSTGAALRGQINPSSTNAIENIVTLLRTTSAGAGANGLGAAIQYELETATSGTSQIAGSLAFEWIDATNATRTSRFRIRGVNSTADVTLATFDGNGNVTFGTTNSIVGTATNNNAAAGNIGEYVESVVTSGSPVSLATTTTANVTSISLTAGDWDVTGVVDYAMTAATATNFLHGVSATSATLGGQDSYAQKPFAFAGSSATLGDNTPTVRISIASTTTVYLVAQATFSGGSIDAFGTIRARRVR